MVSKTQESSGGTSHRHSILGFWFVLANSFFAIKSSNSHYETDFSVSSTEGTGNTKIGFLKACQWRAFKKPIFIMRIAV
jgi:hypothetical protein